MNRGYRVVLALVVLASLSLASCRGCVSKEGQAPSAAGPTRVPCPSLTGTWRIGYNTSCAAKGGVAQTFGTTEVVSDGCNLKFTVRQLGEFESTLEGRSGNLRVRFTDPCAGVADGSVTVTNDKSMVVGFRGTASGGDPRCCDGIYGTVNLVKVPPAKTPTPAPDTPTPAPTTPGKSGSPKKAAKK